MNNFGWSLPPGCGKTPGEEDCDAHPASEKIFDLLENAGVDQSVIDAATKIIDDLVLEYEARYSRLDEVADTMSKRLIELGR